MPTPRRWHGRFGSSRDAPVFLEGRDGGEPEGLRSWEPESDEVRQVCGAGHGGSHAAARGEVAGVDVDLHVGAAMAALRHGAFCCPGPRVDGGFLIRRQRGRSCGSVGSVVGLSAGVDVSRPGCDQHDRADERGSQDHQLDRHGAAFVAPHWDFTNLSTGPSKWTDTCTERNGMNGWTSPFTVTAAVDALRVTVT